MSVLKFRIKSIKQMFNLFIWIMLLIVLICSVFTFVFLNNNIKNAKSSFLNSVCNSTERIISENIEIMNYAESTLRLDRNIQEYLNAADREEANAFKMYAADSVRAAVNGKGANMGAVLFCEKKDCTLLTCNASSNEEEYINNLYLKYKENKDNTYFMYKDDNLSYPEFCICHFTTVVYHSLKNVDFYNVGTLAVVVRVNIYDLKNEIEKNSIMTFALKNENIPESNVVLIDAATNRNGTVHTKNIVLTDWYIYAELYKITGINFVTPFVLLSILLIMILLIYVLILKKSVSTMIDTPIMRLSNYLEEFILSKNDTTVMKTVNVQEFDDILKYINKLFERVNVQARSVVKAQQQMYEKELFASEQTLYMSQMQINPHFLFNTLNTIAQMCRAEGLNEVTDITHNIADIFRYSIEGDYKATIDEEIYIALKYIKIFNSRYGREFRCELDIEDELYEFYVMKMMLQPIIENSFKHGGIAAVEEPLIKISAYRENGYVYITVYDNGTGIPTGKLEAINYDLSVGNTKKDKGIGLLNINKRLKIYYGNESGLFVNSEYGEYTKVVIKIKEFNPGK